DLFDAQIPSLLNPPRMHLLAPHPVLELHRGFEDGDVLPRGGQGVGQRPPGDAAAHDHDIGLIHLASPRPKRRATPWSRPPSNPPPRMVPNHRQPPCPREPGATVATSKSA